MSVREKERDEERDGDAPPLKGHFESSGSLEGVQVKNPAFNFRIIKARHRDKEGEKDFYLLLAFPDMELSGRLNFYLDPVEYDRALKKGKKADTDEPDSKKKADADAPDAKKNAGVDDPDKPRSSTRQSFDAAAQDTAVRPPEAHAPIPEPKPGLTTAMNTAASKAAMEAAADALEGGAHIAKQYATRGNMIVGIVGAAGVLLTGGSVTEALRVGIPFADAVYDLSEGRFIEGAVSVLEEFDITFGLAGNAGRYVLGQLGADVDPSLAETAYEVASALNAAGVNPIDAAKGLLGEDNHSTRVLRAGASMASFRPG